MNDLFDVELLKIVERLIACRFDLAALILGLGKTGEAEEEGPEAELCAVLECAILDHFDPLLKGLLNAAGGPRGALLEAAFDLAVVRHRLESLRAALPSSPDEDAMLAGEIPADLPAEMKMTLVAVIDDQLGTAYENLLQAVRCRAPAADTCFGCTAYT
ncbi:MAG TPA: hypothetical protein VH394_08410 [Thermoanaerobaculia bacterium]|nr:hypothetical protein [Thermoanaerobaculia bacterium]